MINWKCYSCAQIQRIVLIQTITFQYGNFLIELKQGSRTIQPITREKLCSRKKCKWLVMTARQEPDIERNVQRLLLKQRKMFVVWTQQSSRSQWLWILSFILCERLKPYNYTHQMMTMMRYVTCSASHLKKIVSCVL